MTRNFNSFLLNLFIYLAVILFPLQIFSIRVGPNEGAIDLTVICFAIILLIFFFSKDVKFNINKLIFFLFFLIIQILVYLYFQYQPIIKFINSIFPILTLLFFILFADNFKINYKIIYRILVISVLISIFFMIFQIYLQNNYVNNRYIFDTFYLNNWTRPNGTFEEPSHLGAAIYALASGFSAILIVNFKNFSYKKNIFLTLFVIFLILLELKTTKSITILGFIITFIVIIFFSRKFTDFLFISSIGILFLILLDILFFKFSNNFNEYFNEYNILLAYIFNPIENDITFGKAASLIVWLRGFDQTLISFYSSPIFGLSPGSTGHIFFDSNYWFPGQKRLYLHVNIFDAYSLFLRLIIEIGPFFVVCFIFILTFKLIKFKKYILKNINNSFSLMNQYKIFLFFFSLNLIIIAFIKDPNYLRSSIFLSIFLFFNINFTRNIYSLKK